MFKRCLSVFKDQSSTVLFHTTLLIDRHLLQKREKVFVLHICLQHLKKKFYCSI